MSERLVSVKTQWQSQSSILETVLDVFQWLSGLPYHSRDTKHTHTPIPKQHCFATPSVFHLTLKKNWAEMIEMWIYIQSATYQLCHLHVKNHKKMYNSLYKVCLHKLQQDYPLCARFCTGWANDTNYLFLKGQNYSPKNSRTMKPLTTSTTMYGILQVPNVLWRVTNVVWNSENGNLMDSLQCLV